MSNNNVLLEKALGKLLGFEDGASDVLQHLLSIESNDDLLEYLSQLLGDLKPEVLDFAQNVGRFKRGEPLSISIDDKVPKIPEQLPNSGANSAISQSNAAMDKKPVPPPPQSSKAKALQDRQTQKQSKSRVPPPKKKQPPPSSLAKNVKNSNNNNSRSHTSASKGGTQKQGGTIQNVATSKAPPAKPSRPSKGTAKTVCGCYGTMHKALTNCLSCGRISCAKEGYDYCPFCGCLVEENAPQLEGFEEALAVKNKLLGFDREFAKRTVVVDDQSDFQGSTIWLSDKERAEAEMKEQERMEAMKRPKQVLNIAL